MAGKILVIDSVMPNRIILKVKLSGAGYEVDIASSGREGVEIAMRERPDMIIVDMDLPDLAPDELVAQMRLVASLHNVLVIMLSAKNDLDTRLRAFRAGCDEFYAKPYTDTTLLARIRSFFREDEQLRVLAAQSQGQFEHELAGAGFFDGMGLYEMVSNVVIMGDVEDAQRLKHRLHLNKDTKISAHATDVATNNSALPFGNADAVVILSDPSDPNAALHLISNLRGRPQTRDARFCIHFQPQSRAADRDLAYDFGADAIFLADDHVEEMALRLAGLVKRKHRADILRERIKYGLKMAMHDPLTNIPNRRYMLAAMRSFMTKARVSGGSVAVIMCDIDKFKSVNDRFGHNAGDRVLQETAFRLMNALRDGDMIARVGGEEFLIALPNANMGDARAVAERLVAAVRSKPFEVENNPPLLMTISAGIAMAMPDRTTPLDDLIAAVIDEADQAMLTAKAQGRNTVKLGRSAA